VAGVSFHGQLLDRVWAAEDELIRRLAREADIPLELAERWYAEEVRRWMAPHRCELIAALSDLCFADDPEIAARALRLAKRLSPLLQELGDDDE
jgi:hypothetical protein